MALYLVTGNQHKFEEARLIISNIEQVDIDLPEIQSLSSEEVIRAKLEAAANVQSGEFIVEDTSLFFDGLNGLPGTLTKWFIKAIGADGLYKLAESFAVTKAQAQTTIGYRNATGETQFFTGLVEGKIVSPRGGDRFGWDPVFMPNGFDKTFAEMTIEEKTEISPRRLAYDQLAKFLFSNQ